MLSPRRLSSTQQYNAPTYTAPPWFDYLSGAVFHAADERDAPACVPLKSARSIVALIFRA